MSLRLSLWPAVAALVLVLAVAAARSPGHSLQPAPATESAETGPEVRLEPVEVREFHDDGNWDRLTAAGAVYSYARRTLRASDVVVSLGNGETLQGAVIRAPEARWDFDGKKITLPDGARADRQGGWTGVLSAGTLDLAGRILQVPGAASIAGPGFAVTGSNLEWYWWGGKLTLQSPRSRIAPASLPGRKG
jgi:hypothetical protein